MTMAIPRLVLVCWCSWWYLGGASAWVVVGVPTRTTKSTVALEAESSRRQWLSQVTAATAAAVVGASFPAQAQAIAAVSQIAPEKPRAASVCDPSVSAWRQPSNGRTVYLLGTAHISSVSAELAGQLVQDIRPAAVFVELDAKRVGRAGMNTMSSTTPNATGDSPSSPFISSSPSTSSSTVVSSTQPVEPEVTAPKKSKPFSFDLRQRALQAGSAAVGSAIQGMYRKLDTAGFQAGQEFVVAVREGLKVGSTIVLGDRDVEVTLKRLTQALAETDIKALLSPDSELEQSMKQLMPGGGDMTSPSSMDLTDATFKDEMSMYVETMKTKDNVRTIMLQLKAAAPKLYEALVAERDAYMANGLDSLNQFNSIVAVMGIAHVDGVEQNLRSLGWVPVPFKCPKL